jgi:hypothetical protein
MPKRPSGARPSLRRVHCCIRLWSSTLVVRLEAALALFKQVSREDPEDAVPVLFVERCSRFLQAPPPEDWQGFEKMTSK